MGGGMSQVLHGLYLGNIRDSEDKASLCRHGVTHILSVHNNAKPLIQEMSYLCIAASDSTNQNLIQHFKKCIQFIHESRVRGGGCLVHCLAGVSRSTTIVVAYLMTVTNLGWEDCLSAVKCVRSYVDPNFGFQQQLQDYQMNYVTEYRAWLRWEYGRNPYDDQSTVEMLLSQQKEKDELRQAQYQWINRPNIEYPLPYKAYGSCNKWTNT